MRLLAMPSNGDYSPNAYLARFPEWRNSKPVAPVASLTRLFDRWAAETKLRDKAVYSWRRVSGPLVAHLGHDDAAKVAKAEAPPSFVGP